MKVYTIDGDTYLRTTKTQYDKLPAWMKKKCVVRTTPKGRKSYFIPTRYC